MSGLRKLRERFDGLFLHNWCEFIMGITFLTIAVKGKEYHVLADGSFQRFVWLPRSFCVGANTVGHGNGHLVH